MSLREELQATLGAAYALERELGGGGMSRVFVAEDTALGRKVVVKVLAPELAGGVNFERFKREISLAARLQHPHIVPLLSAGEVGGLPFFMMPFVEGESLRARVAHGELPLSDAVAVLRDVAKALEYAHSKGVVHRDIKPDNILLTGGSAAVTDFGVAKAVSESTHGAATLTSVGVALGTPAYMAPEQAAADPSTDHRADIYAFGAMAYEMLVGRSPFASRTAQQMLAAHATEAPVPVTRLRPPVPPSLALLVMRCLEKRPADRPQSARELVQSLDAVATPSPTTVSQYTVSGGRGRWIAVAALVVVAAAAIGLPVYRKWARPTLNAKRVMVAPFENLTGDSAFALTGRMASDFITQGISQLDSVEAVSSSDVLAFTASRTLGVQAVRQLAEQLRAGTVVTGAIYRQTDSLRFQVQVVAVADGKVMRTVEVIGPASNPLAGIETVRDRLMGAMAATEGKGLVLGGAPRYEAYQEALKGSERFHHQDYVGAIPHFARAVALDSSFGSAFGQIAAAFVNIGRIAEGDSVAKIAFRYRDRFSEPDRVLLDWTMATIAGDRAATLRIAKAQAAHDSGFLWLYLTGISAIGRNRARDALDALLAIKEEPQGWSPYWTVLATAYHQVGDFDRELDAAERGNARHPGRLVPSILRALAARGDSRRLGATIDSIVRVSTDTVNTPANFMLTAAREMRAHGHTQDGAELLARARAWIAARPANEIERRRSARRTLADVLFAMSRFDSAQTQYAALAATDSTDIASRGRIGASAALRSDSTTARRVLDDLSRLTIPFRAGEALYWRAAISATLGDKERAAQLLEQSLDRGVRFSDGVHRQEELQLLRGYPPFDAILRPKD